MFDKGITPVHIFGTSNRFIEAYHTVAVVGTAAIMIMLIGSLGTAARSLMAA